MIAVGMLGLIIGVIIATLVLNVSLPEEWAAYLSLAALAGLDTALVVGALRWKGASTPMCSSQALL